MIVQIADIAMDRLMARVRGLLSQEIDGITSESIRCEVGRLIVTEQDLLYCKEIDVLGSLAFDQPMMLNILNGCVTIYRMKQIIREPDLPNAS